MNKISGSSCIHCYHAAKRVESMDRDGFPLNAYWCKAKHRWTDRIPGTCCDYVRYNPANGIPLPTKLRHLQSANRSILSHQSATT